MDINNKKSNIKEKLRQALNSTAKVISDDFKFENDTSKKNNPKKFEFFELENLNSKSDFLKARADSDSSALKRKFSNTQIFKKNLPSNSSCKSLYSIAEKIRYELLGCQMLKGIEKNLKNNYNHLIRHKRKDQLKSKDDVPVVEAFELYMLKKFHNIELNSLTNDMLNFWEKDFDNAIKKHISFLKENLESQDEYSIRFSDILQKMDIFQTDEKDETQDQNQENDDNNSTDDMENNESDDKKEQNKEEEATASLDSDYNIEEYKLDEKLVDTNSDEQNKEQVIQKNNLSNINLEYQIFTNQFDEIVKAENLEKSEDAIKLRKTLDQQLIGFHDVITKLANKLQRQLLAKQNRAWEFDLEEGLLDSSKLPRIVISYILCHLKRKELDFKDTVVTLLIDNLVR